MLGFFSLCAGKVAGVGQRQPQGLSATYTMHNVRAAVEYAGFDLGIKHVSFTAAVIEIGFDGPVYGETIDGKRFDLPVATPFSKSRGDTPVGIMGAVALKCMDRELYIPSFSDEFEDTDGTEASPPWHLVGLPHKASVKYGLSNSIFDILEQKHPELSLLLRKNASAHNAPQKMSQKILIGLILRYEDDSGMAMRNKAFHGVPEMNDPLRECNIHFLKHSQQKLWPTKVFYQSSKGLMVHGQTAKLRLKKGDVLCRNDPKQSKRTLTVSLLSNEVVPDRLQFSHRSLLTKYPRIHKTWSPIVPPLPNFCGVRNGSLLEEQVFALKARHESSFIESRSQSAMGRDKPIPNLPGLTIAFLTMFLPTLFNTFLRQGTDRAANDLNDQIPQDVLANVPEDVVELLGQPLIQNVTALLADGLAASSTAAISVGLGQEMGPKISQVIRKSLVPHIMKQIVPVLESSIPEKIEKVAPYLMARSLPIALSKTLTFSLTHALVPVLTTALTRTSDQEHYCHECYYYHTHCRMCHESPESQYYNSYYSAYYSDFYSAYYADYYTNSLKAIENLQHPPANQDLANRENMGEDYQLKKPEGGSCPTGMQWDAKSEACRHTVGPSEDTSDRVVTADGTRLSEIGAVPELGVEDSAPPPKLPPPH